MSVLSNPAVRAKGAILRSPLAFRAVTGVEIKNAFRRGPSSESRSPSPTRPPPDAGANPTAEAIVEILDGVHSESRVPFDHFAFRTFGVPGLGIGSVSKLLTDYGYKQRDSLSFPSKKLSATWYAAPHPSLPRVFVSEIRVNELSAASQEVIEKYTGTCRGGVPAGHGPLLAAAGVLPWPTPSAADFDVLAGESEYAAWVLVHGYALNHTTISVHGLPGAPSIADLNGELTRCGFRLSSEGGVTKTSPDGLLLQSSTIADRIAYTFSCGITRLLPSAYIEFAERRRLPEFARLPWEEIEEHHRREGFESSNADKIFESTNRSAVGSS